MIFLYVTSFDAIILFAYYFFITRIDWDSPKLVTCDYFCNEQPRFDLNSQTSQSFESIPWPKNFLGMLGKVQMQTKHADMSQKNFLWKCIFLNIHQGHILPYTHKNIF